jgi:uncharacterized iron-regulated membrane protein
MMSGRTVQRWYQVHKWTSLACTLFLLLLCVTGLPLIFSDEIESCCAPPVTADARPAGLPVRGLDSMVAEAAMRYPHEIIRFIFFDKDESQVKIVMAPADVPDRSRDHPVLFESDTARPIGELPSPVQDKALMAAVRRLHTEMLAGFPGQMFLAVMGVLFVMSIISGAVLYSPFMGKRAFASIRTRSSRIRWLDLHNLLGILVLAWAMVVGTTGILNELAAPLSAMWRASESHSMSVPGDNTSMPGKLALVQKAYDQVSHALPNRNVTSMIFPSATFSNSDHFLIWTNGNTALTSRLFTAVFVNAQTGQLSKIAQMPLYLQALQVSRPLHFGDYGGMPLKILWALFDLVAIVVLGSGVSLWLCRR